MNIFPPRVRRQAHALPLLYFPGSSFLLILLTCARLEGQVCNDLSTVSLDATCTVEITPDMVLEGTYVDSLYVVQLSTLSGLPIGNILTVAQLGDTLRATVTDTTTGNSCWGFLFVEDKLPPALSCANLSLPCALPQFTPAYLASLGLSTAYPAVTENCGAYTLTYKDTWVQLDCDDSADRSAYIERVWTAKDGSGNQSSCTQYLNIRRIHIGQLQFPADTLVSCSNPQTAPGFTGQPYYSEFGVNFPLHPDKPFCSLNIAYTDQVLPHCDGSYKILRTWTVFDDCLPSNPVPPMLNPLMHIQVIQVSDKQGPVFTCPKDTTIFTDPFVCKRSFDLPDIIITDNCSRIASIRADWTVDGLPAKLAGTLSDFPGNPDTLGVFGIAPNLPAGIVAIRYTVTDDCGNSSTCIFRITVSDGIPPLVACDEFTRVGLGFGGAIFVNAATFDDGSVDNCSPVYFKARRVEPNGCQSTDHFYDQVKFCCDDVGDTLAVILRVYDLPVDTGAISLTAEEDHASDCLVYVFVEDKLRPVCTPLANTTVSCINFDPSLLAYGQPSFADNCCLDTVVELPPNYTLFDTMCNRGTITRSFRATDCFGLTSQCTQRLVVTYEQNYSIQFPDDILVYDCDTTDVYGPSPVIYDKDCEFIAISYEDVATTGGVQSCYRIDRIWTIINWCGYNPNAPLVEVPNPNPSFDPQNPQNFPGPVVAPPGHFPAATIVKVSPNDPAPTNFSTFWSATANGYRYHQTINVRDNVPPKIRGCPEVTGPVEFCDNSDNDPLYWNEQYWVDPNIANSTNLCESITDLAVTASDGCSKGNVNIRYLLFLDLDGDGVQETVINSINPPPANTVFFGNALNPNFTGGVPRAFDERPVPSDEKYRFTMQVSGFVNRTGWVRWVTDKDPTTYVIPQLPHGHHRIMWIIEDGCGNETICQYPIWIKDCRKPDLVCINGLSVDIMVTKSITLWASDFLLYTKDNCTPPNQLRLGIRKSGTGTGFPYNPDGSPQTSVTFTCDELGPQFVELWVIDAAGNFNVCETYVIVQDNFGVCPNALGSLAGLLQTEKEDGLQDAEVTLHGNHPDFPPAGMSSLSDANGAFHFTNSVPYGGDYTVTPIKDNDPLNGVSTFDLVLISKHILGLEPLNSPYKMIAADANNSRSITTFDIVELRKLILGIQTGFPDNSSWRFVDKAYIFPNPSNPFQEIFSETIQLPNFQASVLNLKFVAVKVGDVNGNAITSDLSGVEDRTRDTLLFDVMPPDRGNGSDGHVRAGEIFTLRFKAAERAAGYQFTLRFPQLELLQIEPGADMAQDNFGVFPEEHALNTSYVGDRAPGEFSLRFRAQEPGEISALIGVSSSITRAEAYPVDAGSANPERMAVALRFTGADGSSQVHGQEFELYQNQPNPWHDQTKIRFYLPESGITHLNVYDEQGQLRLSLNRWQGQGEQNYTLERRQLGAPGVFYYRLETEWGSALGKMILI